MDDSFLLVEEEEELLQGDIQWPLFDQADALVGFEKWDGAGSNVDNNMNKLLLGDSSKKDRHKINERLRRERQRQSYAALHSLLPPRTKADKNSIIQTATLQLQQLKNLKEDLEKRNGEIEQKLLEEKDIATIRLRLQNPSSGIDSMIEVLKCFKSMGLKATQIQSHYSAEEFSAVMQIDTKIEAMLVEEAVQMILEDIESTKPCHPHQQQIIGV